MNEHGYVYDLLRKMGLSDFQANTGEFILVRPAKILVVVAVAFIVGRLGTRAVRRFVRSAQTHSPLRSSARAAQRASTVGDVLAGLVRAVVWAAALLMVLGEVGVQLGPLIAGAGIAGVALGFGAQSLVKDFLSGLFILLEDQYGVGDIIKLEEVTGTVEDVTLRVTRLRAADGTVWFVPNGEIKRVGNSSMEWSRALIDVLVAYGSDVGEVTGLLREVSTAFAAEEPWSADILEPPEVWGVQAMGTDGMTIRLVVKTAPRQQYAVARELRGRISERLRQEGIKGPGQTVLVSAGILDVGTPPPAPIPADEPGAVGEREEGAG